MNNDNNELDFSKDVWQFGNFGEACYTHMSNTDMNALIAGLSPTDLDTIITCASVKHNDIINGEISLML